MGAGDGRFISFHRAGGFHHQRLLSVELLAGDEVGLHQLLVTSEIAAGVGEGGLIFRQLTLRLGESDFKLAGVDLRQQVAGFDLLTLLEVKAQQLAVDPAADGDGIGRRYRTQPGEIARDRFFGGGGRLHRRQRGAKAAMACAARPLRALPGGGSPAAARPAIVPEPVGGPGDNHYRQRGAPTTYVTAFH